MAPSKNLPLKGIGCTVSPGDNTTKPIGGIIFDTETLAAWGLVRSKSYLGAYLRRMRSRLGAPKAITATAHKLARILYTIVRYGVVYQKKSEADFVEQHHQRMEKNLHRRAKELGYELKRIEAPPMEEYAGSACLS